MRDPKKEKRLDFRHGNRKWSRRYDEDGGESIRDLRKKSSPEEVKKFPAKKKLSVEERKAQRTRREALLSKKMAQWCRDLFMRPRLRPSRPVVSPEQAKEDLRYHSRMY